MYYNLSEYTDSKEFTFASEEAAKQEIYEIMDSCGTCIQFQIFQIRIGTGIQSPCKKRFTDAISEHLRIDLQEITPQEVSWKNGTATECSLDYEKVGRVFMPDVYYQLLFSHYYFLNRKSPRML